MARQISVEISDGVKDLITQVTGFQVFTFKFIFKINIF